MEKNIEEKRIRGLNGFLMLFIIIALIIGGLMLIIIPELNGSSFVMPIIGAALIVVTTFLFPGFKVLGPNEAFVLLLFGKYYGTLASEGFYWVNPFCTAYSPIEKSLVETVHSSDSQSDDIVAKPAANKKISLKAMTLNNYKQKVNDEEGNPIEIGVIVIWRIINTAKAVFNVDNYTKYVSIQADSAIRHVARLYPYDISEEGDERSLRGSSQEVADELRKELQSRVDIAGIEIVEARISHLAYAPEIAAAMLQRQQAKAIIDARQKIVEGAVGMVQMALTMLSENQIVELDDERKAQMVSNLMVVLCGNKDAQPIVNSGSIY